MKNNILLVIVILLISFDNVFTQNNALNFDGVNDYVNADGVCDALGSSMTLECWIEPVVGGSETAYFLSFNKSSKANSIQIGIENTGLLKIYDGNTTTSGSTLSTNEWYHIALVLNSSNNDFQLYLNGALDISATTSVRILSTDLFSIGQEWDTNTSNFFKGNMDEVRIWNVARTSLQISDNMNNTSLSASTTGLLAYYHFDQGTIDGDNTGVTSLTDATSNSLNGTLNNFALSGSASNWVSADDNPLPVELTAFTANVSENKVILNW